MRLRISHSKTHCISRITQKTKNIQKLFSLKYYWYIFVAETYKFHNEILFKYIGYF